MHALALVLVLVSQLALASALAAQETADESQSASCTLEDQNQIVLRYQKPGKKDARDLPAGKVWTPGGAPVSLFTETPLRIGNADLAVGAYSIYFLPGKTEWTLVVNKNVAAGSAYDEKQDLARIHMQVVKMDSSSQELTLSLGHIASKQCELRLYFGKVATWATVTEK